MKQCIGVWLALIVFSTFSTTGWVQETQTQESQAQQQERPLALSDERLADLIITLESETARGKFIDNLKTLLEAHQATDEAQARDTFNIPAADALPINADEWGERYQAFLQKHDLTESTVANALGTAGLIIIALLIFWLAARLIRILQRRTSGLVERFHLNDNRINLYFSFLRGAIVVFLALFAFFAVLDLWEFSYERLIKTATIHDIYEKMFSVLVIFLLGAVLLEMASGFSETLLKRATRTGARVNTLLPIVRTVISVTLIVLFGMVMLSELGINVAPLLAGAGIVGLAVGFGAQTVVKDFLTGFIIILEDLIQVGDVASLGGKTGFVERITVRKVQLRDLDGRVYTVPFSEIGVTENLTKDFSFYLLDVGVAYRENTDEVVAILRELDEQMRAEDEYKDLILDPIEILGVDRFADSAVIVRARIKTLPIKQWLVGREFNRRMKHAFDERGIEIPFPHRTLYFGEGKQGGAPPAYVKVDGELAANDADRDQGGKG